MFTGDGGGGGHTHSQVMTLRPLTLSKDLTKMSGKIHRIDIDQVGSPDGNFSIPADNPFVNSNVIGIKKSVYAYGLRNPWRNSFDSVTGELYNGKIPSPIDSQVMSAKNWWRKSTSCRQAPLPPGLTLVGENSKETSSSTPTMPAHLPLMSSSRT